MSDDKPQKDDKTGRFLTGNIGGGRQKGSRNRLGEAFIEDLLHAWESQGPAAIQTVIETKPDAFLKVVASLMPKDLNVNINQLDEMTDEQLIRRVRTLDAAIRPFLDAEGTSLSSGGTGPEKTH